MPGELTPFQETARRITHDWMRHLGYTDEAIADAEAQTCKAAGCEMFGEGYWDHSDENGDSLHPERDELDASSEMVAFVLEHPALCNLTAELVEALHEARGALSLWAPPAVRIEAQERIDAALARHKGES